MREPFEIAGGTQSRVENVLVRVRLKSGARGWGECAPLPAFNGEDQASTLAAVRRAAEELIGQDAARPLAVARRLEHRLGRRGAARAGLEMAALDAWARHARFPLWTYFGGAEALLHTDVTVAIVGPKAAASAARRISRMGIGTIKIKIGKDVESDVERVLAVVGAAPRARLILDANQGYTPAQALGMLRALRRRGVRPALFEQPVAKDDWDGMARVDRDGGVPVAADETVSSREDAWRLARSKAASVVNVKLMKYGISEALEIAAVAKAAGLGLMIGAMIESPLALWCAAQFAGGLGGFSFVDLDTSLWFARHPMRGPGLGRGGAYDVARVRVGTGITPKRA
ncbi:MAG: dipeptide epimerase [Elusimicrobia bacterium]|nr:dipeptide epimerase [Elusimicrobiota bacterium]